MIQLKYMDIENLSKTELIMTALLISFVTALVTGIVIVFLYEDAPDDIIRVTEQITSSEEPASTSTGSNEVRDTGQTEVTATDTPTTTNQEVSRDAILQSVVGAVARISAADTSPEAGVLISDGSPVVVSTTAATSSPQALFENGEVANLSRERTDEVFSVFSVREMSGQLAPLSTSRDLPVAGSSVFAAPLRERPEIIQVTVTDVTDGQIKTSADRLPATSLLFNQAGAVVGLYAPETASFTPIDDI